MHRARKTKRVREEPLPVDLTAGATQDSGTARRSDVEAIGTAPVAPAAAVSVFESQSAPTATLRASRLGVRAIPPVVAPAAGVADDTSEGDASEGASEEADEPAVSPTAAADSAVLAALSTIEALKGLQAAPKERVADRTVETGGAAEENPFGGEFISFGKGAEQERSMARSVDEQGMDDNELADHHARRAADLPPAPDGMPDPDTGSGDDDDDDEDDIAAEDDGEDDEELRRLRLEDIRGCATQKWFGLRCEIFAAYGYARHTVMAVPGKGVTLRGPCAVVGLVGDSVLGGFYCRGRCIRLPDPYAALSLCTPRWRDVASKAGGGGKNLNLRKMQEQQEQGEGAQYSAALAATERDYGSIDWGWVGRVVQQWRDRAGTVPPLVLVLQPKENDRRVASGNDLRRDNTGVGMLERRPAFFAPRAAPVIEPGLLSGAIPAMLRDPAGRVAVVGSVGVGKSTLCRHIANAFISRYGRCLWLDLDLGQGEFTPSGTISLTRLTAPIVHAQRTGPNAVVERECYLGAAVMRDPAAMSRAVAALCAAVPPPGPGSAPLVVNTHGWVLSTGRRSTLEALVRLQPQHVVHLLCPGEPAWVEDEIDALADPARGLSAAAALPCAMLPGLSLGAEFGGATKAKKEAKGRARKTVKDELWAIAGDMAATAGVPQPLAFELHTVDVPAARVKDRGPLRRAAWKTYLRSGWVRRAPLLAAATTVSTAVELAQRQARAGQLCTAAVPLRLLSVLCAEDPVPLPGDAEALAALLQHSLVGLGTASQPPGTVAPLRDVAEAPAIAGYGVVSSVVRPTPDPASWVLELRGPMPGAQLGAAGVNAIVVGWQTPDSTWGLRWPA